MPHPSCPVHGRKPAPTKEERASALERQANREAELGFQVVADRLRGEAKKLRRTLPRKASSPAPERSRHLNLPLPIVHKVLEVHDHQDFSAMDHAGSFCLIAPDPMAGRAARYSVIRVNYRTGQADTIGRELPLGMARKVARRPSTEDGDPVP